MSFSDCRPEVQAFACAMEDALQRNDYKGGWEVSTPLYLFRKLAEEVAELVCVHRGNDLMSHEVHRLVTLAVDLASGPVQGRNTAGISTSDRLISATEMKQLWRPISDRVLAEAADVANIAMMIASIASGLKEIA